MADMDLPGAPGGGGQEHLGGGVVRIFLQEMVLVGPDVVEAETVGDLHLGQRVLNHPVLGFASTGVAIAVRRSGRTSWRVSPALRLCVLLISSEGWLERPASPGGGSVSPSPTDPKPTSGGATSGFPSCPHSSHWPMPPGPAGASAVVAGIRATQARFTD